MYKPEDYGSVAPYLIVDGADDTISFLKQVFDVAELRRYPGENGKVSHAEVRLDDTVLMIADGTERAPSVPANVHVYVPDVDETYQRAIAAAWAGGK